MPKRGPAVLRGRGLRSLGAIEVSAPFLGTDRPLRLLGHVESSTGTIREEGHPLDGQSFAGRVFAFPRGIGSTVAPYVLVEARLHGALPAAILLGSSRDHGTIAAASLLCIPLVYGLPERPWEVFTEGERVTVTLSDGAGEVRGSLTRGR